MPDPLRNHLVLRVDGFSWAALSVSQQDKQADVWQQQSLEIGYEALRLVDQTGRPLARSARVGGGMILFRSEEAA